MKIISLDQIKKCLVKIDIISEIEKAFVAYSNGKAVVSPVGELLFQDPPGDVHIKSGYILGEEYYVIKIASGFYENPKLNLPSSNGLMLLFSQNTGGLCSILLDEGYLTDIRTAVAGAIVAKYLAPRIINKIGMIGTGTQAKLQLHYLKKITSCREVIALGRSDENLQKFKMEMEMEGFQVNTTKEVEEITTSCNLIVTTTPSNFPILFANQIKKGTHITAVGADGPKKQELDADIFKNADVIVADSIMQCTKHGEIAHAIRKKIIDKSKLIELGDILSGMRQGRKNNEQVTVADLTGLAVQDLQIAKSVFESIRKT
ncbi:ornithine cyclodeaminase family protein [Legionella micdadei]|uniref:ornithine cyclodeaminase family protein n=1 Tax=Legionella micdadei TaxID=451 RepID=UPI0009EF6FAE|nr:ornithine cyclodeaminase family protein [Legionella micdadei]ARH00178.1 ornithine cyclodeaminase family protein [Legionella micdadei]